MKILKRMVGLMALGLTGCQFLHEIRHPEQYRNGYTKIVKVSVNAYLDEKYSSALKNQPKLNFRHTSDETRLKVISENQQIVKTCMAAAGELDFKAMVDDKACTDCIDVQITHAFERDYYEGPTETLCSNIGSSFSKYVSCTSWVPKHAVNSRWVALGFYHPSEKRPVYQTLSYSNGPIESVVRVSRELCIAALEDFPIRRENAKYQVPWDPEIINE